MYPALRAVKHGVPGEPGYKELKDEKNYCINYNPNGVCT